MPQPEIKIVHIQSATVSTCNFNRFTARLTRRHLVIRQAGSLQSFPLSDIISVTIFNNAPLYQQQVNSFIKRRKQLYWFMLTPAIALAINCLPITLHAQLYAWLAAPFLAVLICAFLPVSATPVELRCGLIIETEQGTYTYPFTGNQISAKATGHFLQQLKEQKAAVR